MGLDLTARATRDERAGQDRGAGEVQDLLLPFSSDTMGHSPPTRHLNWSDPPAALMPLFQAAFCHRQFARSE